MFGFPQGNSQDVLDAFNTEVMKLAVMGVTIVVSSGNNGAAGNPNLCSVSSDSSTTDWAVSH